MFFIRGEKAKWDTSNYRDYNFTEDKYVTFKEVIWALVIRESEDFELDGVYFRSVMQTNIRGLDGQRVVHIKLDPEEYQPKVEEEIARRKQIEEDKELKEKKRKADRRATLNQRAKEKAELEELEAISTIWDGER